MPFLSRSVFLLLFCATALAQVPKVADPAALRDWATPLAGLGVRPGHFDEAEYQRQIQGTAEPSS